MAETVRCGPMTELGVGWGDEHVRQVGGAGQAKVMGKDFMDCGGRLPTTSALG